MTLPRSGSIDTFLPNPICKVARLVKGSLEFCPPCCLCPLPCLLATPFPSGLRLKVYYLLAGQLEKRETLLHREKGFLRAYALLSSPAFGLVEGASYRTVATLFLFSRVARALEVSFVSPCPSLREGTRFVVLILSTLCSRRYCEFSSPSSLVLFGFHSHRRFTLECACRTLERLSSLFELVRSCCPHFERSCARGDIASLACLTRLCCLGSTPSATLLSSALVVPLSVSRVSLSSWDHIFSSFLLRLEFLLSIGLSRSRRSLPYDEQQE